MEEEIVNFSRNIYAHLNIEIKEKRIYRYEPKIYKVLDNLIY
jgi:hypothetical protein